MKKLLIDIGSLPLESLTGQIAMENETGKSTIM
jgi:hypothetical protein